MNVRSSFSAEIADRIKAGATVSDAIHIVIGGIRDGSGPRTTDVLADLQDMGVWQPKPVTERHE